MPAEAWRFENFELDSSAYKLYRDGILVRLERIPFELLCLLVERRGELVTREEILERVWGKGVFVDSENSINTAVRKIRRALNDVADAPRFVVTVPARGYRFVASIHETNATAATARDGASAPVSAVNMVGREAELARMHEWYAEAIAGRRRVVFVTGEPGIGKSTFLGAFLDSVAAEKRVPIGRGQCIKQYGSGEPYMPVLDALERLALGAGGGRIIESLKKFAPTWLIQMPAILSDSEREGLQSALHGVTQLRMLREIGQALEAIAAEMPLVLLLEDLHWSDFSTLELIAAVARRNEPARLLIVGTFRPAEILGGEHPLRAIKAELQLHNLCEVLELQPLTDEDVATYLVRRFADADELALAQAASVIHRYTEGNPLYVVNVVDYLSRRGSLLDATKIAVPQTIQQMIELNLEQLDHGDQRLLEAASVAGRAFSAASVAAALDQPVGQVEADCVHLARRQQFIVSQGSGAWPDGTVASRFRFHHTLYGEVLYERVPAGHRVEFHRRIAEREEQAFGELAHQNAVALAYHYSRANEKSKAIDYFRLAGEYACRQSAFAEAALHYTNALDILSELPEGLERDRCEIGLQLAFGPVLSAREGWATPRAERAYVRALELCERVDNPADFFQTLLGLWSINLLRGKFQSARSLADKLMDHARHTENPELLLARYAVGVTAFWMGELLRARDQLQLAMELCDPARHVPITLSFDGHEVGVLCAVYLAWVLWHLGFPDAALKSALEAVELARAVSNLHSLVLAESVSGYVHLYRGEAREAQTTAERAIDLANKHELTSWRVNLTILRGAALAHLTRSEEATAYIKDGIVVLDRSGVGGGRAWLLSLLARASQKIGRSDEGLEAAKDGLSTAEENYERNCEAELWRLSGELILACNPSDSTEAQRRFQRAIDIARGHGAKSWELRATTSLTQLLASQDRRDEARAMLAEIYDWFTEGFDTADLKDAKALLDELSR
jgi:DNA-binding winged helix-turn-helix (wHTH) protein/predicted ATPase